jgi:hypothetical protein
MIHEQYPRLRDDCEKGGLASYVKEVAIDISFLDGPVDELEHGASQSDRGEKSFVLSKSSSWVELGDAIVPKMSYDDVELEASDRQPLAAMHWSKA